MIHIMYKHYNKNTLFIVTDKPDEIKDVIDNMTRHGATSIDVTGTYEGTKRTMIYSVISTDELRDVMQHIKAADEKAFINVIKTEQLAGRFYMPRND